MSEARKTFPGCLYYLTLTITGWVDLFTRKCYTDIIIAFKAMPKPGTGNICLRYYAKPFAHGSPQRGRNEVIDQKIDYTHYNPVRAAIVTEPHHYLYSSAHPFSPLKMLTL